MGKVLVFEIGAHWDAKKALKWLAFSLKFDINLLLIKMGSINGIFFPLQRVFSISQYDLALV